MREFAVSLELADVDGVRRVLARCAAEGVNPGYALGRDYPEHPDGLLVAITEQRSREDIDRLAERARPGARRPSARRPRRAS